MPICKRSDVEIFYEDIGFGEPILFLHSHYNRGILAFACQMQAFHKKYRCILPDFRGHGRTRSDNPDWSIPKSVEDMVGLLDALKIDKAHLIGYGGGAVTGFHIAIKHPERVVSLVSIGYSGLPYPKDESDEFLAEGLLRNRQFDIINEINRKHFDAHKGDWQGFLRKTQIDDNSYTDLGEERVRAIAAPVFLIAGEHDPYSTPQQHERMKQLLPGCEVMECKGGSHNVHMVGEHTVAINKAILSFLERHAFKEKVEGILPIV
ncbi:MAG: alpha/beta hydrolase [Bacillota bacterium]